MTPQKQKRGLIHIPALSIYNTIAQILVVCRRCFLIMHLEWQVSLHAWARKDSTLPRRHQKSTKQQQQTPNNSLLASLLNNTHAKPLKHVVFYVTGLAAAGASILFLAGVNVNAWCEPSAADGLTSVFNASHSRWLFSAASKSHTACWWCPIHTSCSPVDCVGEIVSRCWCRLPPKSLYAAFLRERAVSGGWGRRRGLR